ncbi:uncharacterized protein LOC110103830 [Dendrobium catenatum]|uniref:uncharacterized protein LOC110103830 n=1 Tax=Dendrobium catenatum TaxID=906689 RepID=UPI0009F28B9E|nr:uncharacterized protein LOC110103830 [Dendrobium catenatum]
MAQNEKKGARAFLCSPSTWDMADFMATNDLVDPGFVGMVFTWTNNKDARNKIFSRLDRFLVGSAIMDAFQGLQVTHLTRLASDHCPILCFVQGRPKYVFSPWIKFEDVWASFPKAQHLVLEKWKILDHGSEAAQLQRKCNRTLKALFFWSKNKFKMLNKLREELDGEIWTLQDLEGQPNGLNESQTEQLRYKVQLLNFTLTRIMTWWKQRAKVKWIEEGDGNTRFFHSMASARRRTKCIESIKNETGDVVTEHGEISNIFFRFFDKKWKGQPIVESEWSSLEAYRDSIMQFAVLL